MRNRLLMRSKNYCDSIEAEAWVEEQVDLAGHHLARQMDCLELDSDFPDGNYWMMMVLAEIGFQRELVRPLIFWVG